MSQTHKFFPTCVYVEEDCLNQQQIKKAINLSNKISKKIPDTKNPFINQTYSTIRTYDIVKDSSFNFVTEKITKHVNLYNKEFLSKYTYQPLGGWINIYSKTFHYQEAHIHAHSTYSAVLFLQSNEYSSPLYFENPNSEMTPPHEREGFNDMTYNTVNFKPIPGQLLIFRSDIRHFVPPSLKENKRMTLSYNY
tara:strand:+ start:7006 stop:7584 length:579 start_codon:yes stop_codon:yes gene_type:complete